MGMATSELLFLTIFCLLLAALQPYHLVLEAARVLDQNQPTHGDDENNKGAVRGHPGKQDGSHVSHTPTRSKSTVESGQYVRSQGSVHHLCPDYIHHGSTCDIYSSRAPPSPKSPDTADPLEAYHFNCTVCN